MLGGEVDLNAFVRRHHAAAPGRPPAARDAQRGARARQPRVLELQSARALRHRDLIQVGRSRGEVQAAEARLRGTLIHTLLERLPAVAVLPIRELDADEVSALEEPEAEGQDGDVAVAAAPVRAEQKIGRNELCPCGSGKKYKHCHGQVN